MAPPFLSTKWGKALTGIVALLLFVLALQILKTSARSLGPLVVRWLDVDDAAGALGFGWLAAYVVMSGSPIAAMALTFFVNGVFSDVQTFVAIAGSRLGASFIVLLVGFVYHLRGRDRETSLQMGVLALLVTYSVYLPAIGVGWLLLRSGGLDRVRLDAPAFLVDSIEIVFDPIVAGLDRFLPFGILFLAGFGLMLLAFHLFDRALPSLDEESPVRDLQAHVFRPVVMFAIGFAITLVTLSVSVSLSVLVPLSAKGIARRENIIPYVMGANVSTFVDTLFATLVLAAPRAFTIVLVEMIAVGAVSLAIIALVYERYERIVLRGVGWVLKSNATLAGFLVVIFAVPILLLLV